MQKPAPAAVDAEMKLTDAVCMTRFGIGHCSVVRGRTLTGSPR
jgi:hypothetical protein